MQVLTLQRTMNRLVCISDAYLKEVIRFILIFDHIQLLSWGSRRLRYDGEWKTLPDMLRTVTNETIWKSLEREILDNKKSAAGCGSNADGQGEND